MRELAAFERRHGAKHGAYVYGATVGKVKRERAKGGEGMARRHGHGHKRNCRCGFCRGKRR